MDNLHNLYHFQIDGISFYGFEIFIGVGILAAMAIFNSKLQKSATSEREIALFLAFGVGAFTYFTIDSNPWLLPDTSEDRLFSTALLFFCTFLLLNIFYATKLEHSPSAAHVNACVWAIIIFSPFILAAEAIEAPSFGKPSPSLGFVNHFEATNIAARTIDGVTNVAYQATEAETATVKLQLANVGNSLDQEQVTSQVSRFFTQWPSSKQNFDLQGVTYYPERDTIEATVKSIGHHFISIYRLLISVAVVFLAWLLRKQVGIKTLFVTSLLIQLGITAAYNTTMPTIQIVLVAIICLSLLTFYILERFALSKTQA